MCGRFYIPEEDENGHEIHHDMGDVQIYAVFAVEGFEEDHAEGLSVENLQFP